MDVSKRGRNRLDNRPGATGGDDHQSKPEDDDRPDTSGSDNLRGTAGGDDGYDGVSRNRRRGEPEGDDRCGASVGSDQLRGEPDSDDRHDGASELRPLQAAPDVGASADGPSQHGPSGLGAVADGTAAHGTPEIGIKQIASRLQMSASTVSRALNGVYGVNETTRAKVLEAAREMGYVPFMAAKQLVGKGSGLIGLFAPEFDTEASPGFTRLIAPLQRALNRYGKDAIVFSVPYADCPPSRLSASIGPRGLEGCILLPAIAADHPLMQEALAQNVPCVNFEGVTGPRCAAVVSDDREGARQTARLLLRKGHRVIGYIDGPPRLRACRERYEGFTAALRDSGLTHGPELLAHGDFSGASGASAVMRLRRDNPGMTAVMCANDLMAMGAMQALAAAVPSVPGNIRVSVVGYDGDFFTAYTVPPLTTVRHDYAVMAVRAAERMIGLLRGDIGTSETVMPLLIDRDSVADKSEEVRPWKRQRQPQASR